MLWVGKTKKKERCGVSLAGCGTGKKKVRYP